MPVKSRPPGLHARVASRHAHDSTDTRQEKVDLGAELGMEIEEVKKQPPLGLRRKKRPDIGAGRPVPGVANKSRPATPSSLVEFYPVS